MSLEEKKEKILQLLREFYQEKQDSTWDKDKDWVAYSGAVYDENEYVAAVRSLMDEWLIVGPQTKIFEQKFPPLLGRTRGIFTNSGSSANLLMMAAAKSPNLYNMKNGDKILTPVVCFPTTLNPILQLGFTPVFVDVTLPSLNLDLDQVEQKLEEHGDIKAIMFAHVLGNPPDMDRLMGLVKKYNLYLFEDSCDALGSTYNGTKLGAFGHLSTCSFFPAHHITTGEGGFVATNDSNAHKVLYSLRDWGRGCFCNMKTPGNVVAQTACKNRFKKWLPGFPEVVYDHRYVFNEVGYNLKPLDLQAAMGLEQLKKVDKFDESRRNNFKSLSKIFKKHEKHFHLPVAEKNSDPCWFAYLLTVKEGATFTKQQFVDHLEKNRIQTRSYFSGNILAHSGYSDLAKTISPDLSKDFPVAKQVTTNSFFIGTFIGITEEKIKYIEEVVESFFSGDK